MVFSQLIIITSIASLAQALSPLQKLREYERYDKELLYELDTYIQRQEENILFIRRELEGILKEVPPSNGSREYLGHPLNSFSLVRRLQKQWLRALTFVEHNYILQEYKQKMKAVHEYIQKTLAYMTQNIVKLQNIYRLSIEDLARGYVKESKAFSYVSASDCVTIALHYFHKTLQYPEATLWLKQAVDKMNSSDSTVNPAIVFEYGFLAECFSGDSIAAIEVYKALIDWDPNFKPSDSLSEEYRLALGNCTVASKIKEETAKNISLRFPYSKTVEDFSDSVCRGFLLPQAGLKCRYVHYNKPHLMVQPFKLEEFHIDPPVVMFYDVISDEETEAIKELAEPMFERSRIDYGKQGITRQSETAWLEGATEVEEKLARRISEVTNLMTYLSEDLQVAMYGVGGEYIGHYDFHIRGIPGKDARTTNRMATFMIYLNDVEVGGHTGFPDLQISVPPRKGAAVFWYNTKSDGDADTNMFHNACPVALGHKTVVTQWILLAGNEFQRPCLLNPDQSFKYFYL